MERQAIDRVHRIGQTKPVSVVRLIMKHSVENKARKRPSSELLLLLLFAASMSLILPSR